MSQITSASLVLASPAEQAERWNLHFAEWGAGFPRALFLRREAALSESEYAQGKLRQWLWLGGDGEVLASSETYATKAWYADPGGPHGVVKVESVASVLVAPELRRHGHAAAMMEALVARLRAEGAAVSTLFTDVGPSLYRRSGYHLHPARQSVRDVDAGAAWPAGATELGLGDLADLFERESDHLSAWLGASIAPAIAEIPAVDRIAWFLTRARYRAWARGLQPTEVVGAACRDGGYCVWTAESADPVLHVLVWRPGDHAGAVRLTDAALAHASERGLRQVVWWDADRDVGIDPYRRPPLRPAGARAVDRSDGLPMLAWLDPTRPMPLVWIGIERFGWC